jgi:hypothetical protein
MITRRTFVDGLIGVAVLTPLAAGSARAVPSLGGGASLVLWEETVLGDFQPGRMDVSHKLDAALDDMSWKREAELLLRQHVVSNIFVIARPATAFVVSRSLDSYWRVVGEGVHGRNAPDEHVVAGFQPVLSRLRMTDGGLNSPSQFIEALNSVTGTPHGTSSETKFRADPWSDHELSSIFALPRSVV